MLLNIAHKMVFFIIDNLPVKPYYRFKIHCWLSRAPKHLTFKEILIEKLYKLDVQEIKDCYVPKSVPDNYNKIIENHDKNIEKALEIFSFICKQTIVRICCENHRAYLKIKEIKKMLHDKLEELE